MTQIIDAISKYDEYINELILLINRAIDMQNTIDAKKRPLEHIDCVEAIVNYSTYVSVKYVDFDGDPRWIDLTHNLFLDVSDDKLEIYVSELKRLNHAESELKELGNRYTGFIKMIDLDSGYLNEKFYQDYEHVKNESTAMEEKIESIKFHMHELSSDDET